MNDIPVDNSMADAEAIRALEQFVVDNDDLLALESLIGKFNIFDALGIARVEIRHSNFLAFILDPAESHGQGQLFLKAILMDILKSAPANSRPFSPIELDGADLRGVEVRREWEHIDLLITCEQPPFVVVIENKVDSKEHSNQLIRYQKVVALHFPQSRPFYVFLSPNADEPSEAGWVPYSYEDIHRVLSRIRGTYENAIGDDVLVFLDHYLNLIGTRFMDSPTLDDLCRRIYKNHRQALELIFERVGINASGVLSEADATLRGDSRWHVFDRTSKRIDFIPAAWLEWLPKFGLDSKTQQQSWLILRFYLYEGKLDFYVEVRRIDDLSQRKQLVELLMAEAAKAGLKKSAGSEITDKYTRVSGRETVLKWAAEEEPKADEIQQAVKAKLDGLYTKIEIIAVALKSFFKNSVASAT